MFKYGIKHQYLNQNPLNLVDINYRNSEYQKRPEQKYLDEDELQAVLKFMYQQSAHYGRFCEFLYLTGMRYGETAALTPQDIQFNSSGDVWVAIQGTIVNGKSNHLLNQVAAGETLLFPRVLSKSAKINY